MLENNKMAQDGCLKSIRGVWIPLDGKMMLMYADQTCISNVLFIKIIANTSHELFKFTLFKSIIKEKVFFRLTRVNLEKCLSFGH